MKKSWYEDLFTNYANTYDKETFTTGTLGEVDFIEQELESDKSKTILDIGCGTGRHAIELAKRGYIVTGIDLSLDQLNKAREKADAARVNVTWIQGDARLFDLGKKYDLVQIICEGGFSLMETDEMNFAILESAAKHQKSGGKLILNALNALFPLYHSVKDFINENAEEGSTAEHSFDLMTFRDKSTFTVKDDAGKKKVLHCNERYFTPPEITWMLKSLNFRNISIQGCKLGAWSRTDKLTTEDYQMLVIAEIV